MTTVYIGIGSNMGDRAGACLTAAERMDRAPGCRVRTLSSLYRTEPVGVERQQWYVNAVAELRTGAPARSLLKRLLDIERALGRERAEKWGPRTLDLDILLYGGRVIQEPDLIVPHPCMHLRRFVLVPLKELAPDLVHPVLKKSVSALLDDVPEEGQRVALLEER